jgi:NAD(P)-dependent dehydrogenase (short-subunit alcohol dehydrogenase family)
MLSIFDLAGKVAVITGSTQGMGLSIALALGQAGASVVISGRTEESSKKGQSILEAHGISARAFPLDVSDSASVENFARVAQSAFGKVDILILNAAGEAPTGSILSHTGDQFDKVMTGNVKANFTLVNHMAPAMVQRGEGSITFISSRAAKRGSAMLGLYAMSKAAIDQYVRNLALELGPSSINVNSICPGPVRTEFSKVLWQDPVNEAKMAAATPMRRIGEADDVAGLALLLSSAAGHFIHGQNISVDGGVTA